MITPATVAGQSNRVHLEPDSGLANYNARRSFAYAVGEELALQRTISADAFLFLYKELVRLCKNRTYCWAGVDWLAQRLETSQGTVKRWITQLVAAGLIQRKTRPGGDTALTSVCALIVYDQRNGNEASHAERSESESHVPPFPVVPPEVPQPSEALFFAPRERITNESDDGSKLIRHTVKKHDPNNGLVGSRSGTVEEKITPHLVDDLNDNRVVQRLIQAGVADPGVLQELQNTPLSEIEAVCRYVAAQQNCYNPPGLVVSLVRAGIGAALLRKSCIPAERQRSGRRRSTGHRTVRASTAPSYTSSASRSEAEIGDGTTDLWTAAQAVLAERIPASEFAAWLQETRIVAYRDGQAVIGVPNVFARDKLDIMYRSDIVEVLQAITGSSLALEVVIDDGFRYCG